MENQELGYNGSWIFKLFVNNRTSKDFTVADSHLHWGFWYRKNEDDNEPAKIKANSNAEALGIRAAAGTLTGYECTCHWIASDGSGSINLYIDVPYSKSNNSSLKVDGFLRQSGWEELPSNGHRFDRSIILYEIDNKIMVHDESVSIDDDPDYRRYLDNLLNDNECIQNWSALEKELKVIESFNPIEYIPKNYLYPPKNFMIARSEPYSIKKEKWKYINDPLYTEYYQKKERVDEYFAVVVHSINTDPRSVQSVPAGAKVVKETSIETSSSIKSTLETSLSIKALVSAEAAGIKAELESFFSIKDITEKSNSIVTREDKLIEIRESDRNRLFVQWMFLTALAIYRKKKDGTVSLIGISEWGDQIIDYVYEY